jgi:hypothetical protein
MKYPQPKFLTMKMKSTSPAFAKATAGRQSAPENASTFQAFNDSTRRSHLRVLFGLFVMLAGVFLALVSFGPATTGFAQGTTREQIAVALAQALNVQIPACVPGQEMFNDVPASSPFCPFIEELVRRGITGGCGGGNYCPNNPVTRAQMAAFLVKVNGSESHTTNTGEANTVTGVGTLQSNTTGSFNTANGYQALFKNATGSENTATGAQALLSNTSGIQNTAHGAFALFSNSEGSANTANGDSALFNNTRGTGNTATGFQALFGNAGGSFNTANGNGALGANTTGSANTATGDSALGSNTTGGGNTATGQVALASNTTGGGNTAHGQFALASNTSGASNTAVGFNALGELATGNFNTALGLDAGTGVTTANNVICIRHPGANVSGTTWIGNIYGVSTQSGTTLPVVVSNGGQLGTASSSRRFKKEIEPMDKASESILALKPVTFHYKNDAMNTPQFGLIAEEVAEVNPDLIVRGENDEIYTVRYDAINAMLLNEFLKEHKKVGKLEATLEAVNARLREQAAQIQKVTAQVDATKPLPHLVLNNP